MDLERGEHNAVLGRELCKAASVNIGLLSLGREAGRIYVGRWAGRVYFGRWAGLASASMAHPCHAISAWLQSNALPGNDVAWAALVTHGVAPSPRPNLLAQRCSAKFRPVDGSKIKHARDAWARRRSREPETAAFKAHTCLEDPGRRHRKSVAAGKGMDLNDDAGVVKDEVAVEARRRRRFRILTADRPTRPPTASLLPGNSSQLRHKP
eukprot:356652-Chlamydomonas_euryale.AAC.6